jgi:hypothetical protein
MTGMIFIIQPFVQVTYNRFWKNNLTLRIPSDSDDRWLYPPWEADG